MRLSRFRKVFNQQKAFKNKLSRISALKNSIKLSKEVLSIPINGNLSYKEIEFISNNIKKYYNV